MTFDISNADPERIRLQLESAVQSNEFTLIGLTFDLEITREALEAVADEDSAAQHRASVDNIERDIEFYTKKYEVAKRKLDEFLASN